MFEDNYVEIEHEDGTIEQISVEVIESRDLFPQSNLAVKHRQQIATDDFLSVARKLVDDGQAGNMTEAMKKVRRRQPELHEAFKAGSKPPRYPVTAQQFKSNEKFRALIKRYRLALDQASRAIEAGHQSIGRGVLKEAERILLELRQLLREDKYRDLLACRNHLTRKLHEAIVSNRGDRQGLGEQLVIIDSQIAVV